MERVLYSAIVPSPKQLPLPQSPCPLPGEEPLHKHDNPDDVFLGCLDKCDLYFHRGPNGTAVISRGGSGAGDYWSGMNMAVQGLEPTLTEALRRAVALGLCDANGIPVSHEFAHEKYPFDVLSANGWFTDYDRVFAGNHHVVCEVKNVPDRGGIAQAISAVGELAQAANDAYEWLKEQEVTSPGLGIKACIIKLRLALQKAGINPSK